MGQLFSYLHVFAGQSLALIALDIIGSNAVEVKECGIRLVMMFLMGNEKRLDQKQLAIFEKMSGFQVMSENICKNLDYCCDSLLERLFALLFWTHDESSIFYELLASNKAPSMKRYS